MKWDETQAHFIILFKHRQKQGHCKPQNNKHPSPAKPDSLCCLANDSVSFAPVCPRWGLLRCTKNYSHFLPPLQSESFVPWTLPKMPSESCSPVSLSQGPLPEAAPAPRSVCLPPLWALRSCSLAAVLLLAVWLEGTGDKPLLGLAWSAVLMAGRQKGPTHSSWSLGSCYLIDLL